MSLITRCPACETMFKVVPDQLRISEGWVRCGQCGEIFNASQNLVAADTSQPAPPDRPAPPPSPIPPLSGPRGPMLAPAETTPGMADVAPADLPAMPAPMRAMPDGRRGEFEQKVWDLQPAPEDGESGHEAAPGVAQAPPPREPAPVEPAFAPVEPIWSEPLAAPNVPAADTEEAVAALAAAARSATDDRDDSTPALPPAAEDAPEPVSFLREEQGARFWNRRPVRLALMALAVLLTALLLAQVLVQERNRIALVEPATRPVLQALCALSRCEIGPLRQIESVVIDSSSFGRLRTDGYRLGFSLRNQAPIDIAMPAIELSLTDTQDQALVRRVILPSEFGAPSNVLAAGADWSATLALSIRPGTAGERIAGYRLLAFYP